MRDSNLVNDSSELEEVIDKEASLSLRTKESLKVEFKSIDGKTDNEKLVKLLELHRKFQEKQDIFNIDNYMNSIDKSLENIHIQFNAITKAVNQEHENMISTYVIGTADELKLLKSEIENEEVINAKTIKLEKEIELLQKRFEEKERIALSYKDKVLNLESERNDLLLKNSTLIKKESEYINQLRKIESVISSRENEITKLDNVYEKQLKVIKEEYQSKLEKNRIDSSIIVKELNESLILVDKQKAVLENNITYLEKENKVLENRVEAIIKESREEIRILEKENNLIYISKAKLESKIENLEKQIKELQEKKDFTINI